MEKQKQIDRFKKMFFQFSLFALILSGFFIFFSSKAKALTATGGNITTDGEYTIHTFTSSGTFDVTSGNGEVEYLVVGGGGSGESGHSGGGGGGGVLTGTGHSVNEGEYSILVGNSDEDSSFDGITAYAGGQGGNDDGENGGSGGGGGSRYYDGPNPGGTGNQGGNGGQGVSYDDNANFGSGGGGGAGGNGLNGSSGYGGNGGAGVSSSISGTLSYYGGGGGGTGKTVGGTSGLGGGGNGAVGTDIFYSTNGTQNTGGGAGGGPTDYDGNPALGGSGVIIIKYLTSNSNPPSTDVNLGLDATISLTCTDSVTLGTITGTGQSSLSTNEALCTVSTNNSSGYSLSWLSSTAYLENGTGDQIGAYTPITPDTPENWSVSSTESEWGAKLKSGSTTYNSSTWGNEDTYSSGNWLNIATSPYQIITRTTETAQEGDNETILFGAEIGSNKFQPTGTYDTDVVITATTL